MVLASRGRGANVECGRCLCQPSHVGDAAAGMLARLVHGRPGGACHLVGPRARTSRELTAAIAGALGVPAPAGRYLGRGGGLAPGSRGLRRSSRIAPPDAKKPRTRLRGPQRDIAPASGGTTI
jgi:hypothetical protein